MKTKQDKNIHGKKAKDFPDVVDMFVSEPKKKALDFLTEEELELLSEFSKSPEFKVLHKVGQIKVLQNAMKMASNELDPRYEPSIQLGILKGYQAGMKKILDLAPAADQRYKRIIEERKALAKKDEDVQDVNKKPRLPATKFYTTT